MPAARQPRPRWLDYARAALAVVAIALLGAPLLGQFDLANIAMLFPLAVLFAAIRLGRGPAVFAAFLSVALFDFFFVHPHFTLAVSDLQYLLTFAVLLAVALTTAELAAGLRRERDSAEARGEEAARARLAVESERLRNTLLASLSHDLRTPLTALAGLAESLPLAGPPLPPAQAELAEAIRTEALRTHALARDLLDFARLQSEAPQLALDWIAADELVASAVQSRAHTLRAHTPTLDLADDLPLLRADAVLLERVLCNLLDNAVAHTAAGGRITIGARSTATGAAPDAAPAWLEIAVCDDGCGLPPGREQAIFERFVRGADPRPAGAAARPGESGRVRTTGDEGSGLGLALVRAIIEAHGGDVGGHNRPCGGACFTLRLPLPPQPEPPPAEAPALSTRRRT
jgi:two-component system sensor histidine kinase KdpD